MNFQILFISIVLVFLISCDSGSQSMENGKQQAITMPKENPKFPTKKEVDKIPSQRQPSGGVMVESEVKVEEKQVDDRGVDYADFATKVCNCARESDALNTKMKRYSETGNSAAFTELVPKVAAAYEQSATCAKNVANNVKSEFMMNKLVPALKQQCPNYDDKLIWQMFLSIKNR